MNQTSNALDAALDAAAPTRELWLAGKTAFMDAIASNSDDIKAAYYAALDAAAPDETSWLAGRNELVLHGVHLLPSSTRTPLKFPKIRTPKGGAVFGIILGILIAIVVAFIVGLLVNNALTALIPILWLIQLVLVVGGAALGHRAATKPKVEPYRVH
jgi:hypothetical protein